MDVITCAIFRDCLLRGVGVVRGVSLPSPIDLTRRPYNTGRDRVICLSCTVTESASNIGVTLKCGLGFVQGHGKWRHIK